MGCITSTNKLQNNENVFRVRVAHLQPRPSGSPGSPIATTITRSGYLELTPRELIFLAPGSEPIVWALQHLRRYGLNADLFSFEAGRRCMSGPGIYTFRVQNADQLYPMFQRYINAVNTDALAQVERERVNSTNSVSVLMGIGGRARFDGNPHSNNYLEPAPLIARNLSHNLTDGNAALQQETNATPDSPDLLSFTPYTNTPTNLYFDQPFRGLTEVYPSQKEETDDMTSTPPTARTLDRPPLESAPPPAAPATAVGSVMDTTMHMYANVETPTACNLRDRLIFDLSSGDRCYENVGRLDLPLQRESCSSTVSVSAPPEPNTPTSITAPPLGGSEVNYIVLDLDQPRSPAAMQSSPKTLNNGFGSGLSLVSVVAIAKTAPVTPDATTTSSAGLDVTGGSQMQAHSLNSVTTTTETELGVTKSENPTAAAPSSSSSCTQGYSTIDFIRTYALNKSSTEMPELPPPAHLRHHHTHQHPHEAEELRITRHSKCIRKAYSISE